MTYITRDEAIKLAGLENVEKAEHDNAEFSNYTENDQTVLSCGQASFYDKDNGFTVTVKAYYEHDRAEYDAAEQLDELTWQIIGYTVD